MPVNIDFPKYRLLYSGSNLTVPTNTGISRWYQPVGNFVLPLQYRAYTVSNGIVRREYIYNAYTGNIIFIYKNNISTSGYPYTHSCIGTNPDGYSMRSIIRNSSGEVTSDTTNSYTIRSIDTGSDTKYWYLESPLPFANDGSNWDLSGATAVSFTYDDMNTSIHSLLGVDSNVAIYGETMIFPPSPYPDNFDISGCVEDYNVTERSGSFGSDATRGVRMFSLATLSGIPITYISISSILNGPAQANIGAEIEVDVSFPDGYKLKDATQGSGISVYNDNGYIEFTYDEATHKLRFIMPE